MSSCGRREPGASPMMKMRPEVGGEEDMEVGWDTPGLQQQIQSGGSCPEWGERRSGHRAGRRPQRQWRAGTAARVSRDAARGPSLAVGCVWDLTPSSAEARRRHT